MLVSTEENLNDAKDYVEKSVIHLDDAVKYHKNTRSKVACVIIVVVIIAVILIVCFWYTKFGK